MRSHQDFQGKDPFAIYNETKDVALIILPEKHLYCKKADLISIVTVSESFNNVIISPEHRDIKYHNCSYIHQKGEEKRIYLTRPA